MTVLPPDRSHAEQVRQRARVGLVGLAAVVLLIGLASAILATVNREQPVTAAGAARPDVVANMADAPVASVAGSEPLVEMGVAPATGNAAAPATQATPAQ
ncbi:hypothetical protein ASG29_05140 [Sphingomonas sp. Leaf412]|uniref:hypothetical protein n=1 Tax=Sphingomonas sp. Leaf412 TaxID=1736370 RepID=UPI0006FEED66|nr:hypothetical protein [Sphingomonas sp. Leaf412]KQT33435.1 hypothetical protein ASG29_05140 [Sphingomonas sp. Leaf412]